MLERGKRYLQIAFNQGTDTVQRVLPSIPANDRILIEAGTPYIKRYGSEGISLISGIWRGMVVADLKTSDGAVGEVALARGGGATAATVVGSAPVETLNRFVAACNDEGLDSMIDMLGVADPLRVLMQMKHIPTVVVLHRGRDEESTRGKVIQYRHVNRIKSKFNVLISAAGGVDLREARSAIFNGADIVVVNIATGDDEWVGMNAEEDVALLAQEFLETIE